MKILMTSAALLALAVTAPVQAQPPVAVGGGVGATSGLAGQVGQAPLGTPGQVNAPPNVGTPIVPSADDVTANPGAIKDGRSLNAGTAAVDASANASDSGRRSQALLAGGMAIHDMGGMALGKVVSVSKSSSGQVTNVVIQTTDGVRRSVPASGLTVKGGVAVTSQSEADLVAFPSIR
jgi:hypothetical protein